MTWATLSVRSCLLLSFFTFVNVVAGRSCDAHCQLAKKGITVKTNIAKEDSMFDGLAQSECHVHGIDLSAHFSTFTLITEPELDKAMLCDGCAELNATNPTEFRHGYRVYFNSTTNITELIDVFVQCALVPPSNPDDLLTELIVEYVANTPERSLGVLQVEDSANLQKCVDEYGLAVEMMTDTNACMFLLFVAETGTYDANGKRIRDRVQKYAGQLNFNRVNQSRAITEDLDGAVQHFSFVSYLHHHDAICTFRGLRSDNRCYQVLKDSFYGVLCCCYDDPAHCILRRNEQYVCATGTYHFHLASTRFLEEEVNNVSLAAIDQHFRRDYCTTKYTMNSTDITVEMPVAVPDGEADKFDCIWFANERPFCRLESIVCPLHPEPTSVVMCCCYGHLCNLDAARTKALHRYTDYTKRVCRKTMLYSLLYTDNYTLAEDDRQPLCPMHYDPVRSMTMDVLAHNNIIIYRDEDFASYRREGCGFLVAKYGSRIEAPCPKDGFSHHDFVVPRPMFMCTCKGRHLDGNSTEPFCDANVKEYMEKKFREIGEPNLPKCFVTTTPIERFSERLRVSQFEKNTSRLGARSSTFCQMRMERESNEKRRFTLTANIASPEQHGELCFKMFNKLKWGNRSFPFCPDMGESKNVFVCCQLNLDNRNMLELYHHMRNLVVENTIKSNRDAIKQKYERLHDTHCPTSQVLLANASLGSASMEPCTMPLGCYWTEGERATVKSEFLAGCISNIATTLKAHPENPAQRALQACLMYSMESLKLRKRDHYPAYTCFHTNEIDGANQFDKTFAPIIVCCCTRLNERGTCKQPDEDKNKKYGVKVNEISKYAKIHNVSYAVPY